MTEHLRKSEYNARLIISVALCALFTAVSTGLPLLVHVRLCHSHCETHRCANDDRNSQHHKDSHSGGPDEKHCLFCKSFISLLIKNLIEPDGLEFELVPVLTADQLYDRHIILLFFSDKSPRAPPASFC